MRFELCPRRRWRPPSPTRERDSGRPGDGERLRRRGGKDRRLRLAGPSPKRLGSGWFFDRGIAVTAPNTSTRSETTPSRVRIRPPGVPPDLQPGHTQRPQTPERHNYGDFQVTPHGRYVVFTSVLPLTGYDNDGDYEVFRYDRKTGSPASPAIRRGPALGDSTLRRPASVSCRTGQSSSTPTTR